ncbi:flagellar assembly protein A [Candidatus Accumulibacter aalborgensis]|uniref:flagellar assembly protein A n=1 Tax=Candidatus Accumulibacter aalborgensis TaxID=1860102 RepID=UPI001648C5B8|nr:flagellar assembly protein A [Candidatus Accumulibacter aalborgensis]
MYVIVARLESAADFLGFVNGVVASGLYFRALEYPSFLSLLYDDPASCLAAGDDIFIAADITAFRPERQALYKALRIANGEAAYLFEPVYLEPSTSEAPVEEGDARQRRMVGGGRRSVETRVRLDRDEFIASAWAKCVRFGIDLDAVHEGILLDKPEWRVVARNRPFVPGKDAEITEQAMGLRRNNAPRRLLGDKVDLRQFETRYPQVIAGIRLVKKIPRTLGEDGRDVTGKVLAAPLAKDFDLTSLAGPGTRVSRESDGEYLLASVCGFLNIDMRSNQFSVADKIVSHEGVSARTTGDLSLTGEIYEQHGEIQEKRVVKCRSITAYADVFGNIVSAGGIVHLKHNLVGGSASNDEGDIMVDGVASGATLIAHQGCISVQRADNCVIVGRQVVIGHATLCDIVAEELSLEVAESCAVAGKTLSVRLARARRDIDNVLLVLLPDLSSFAAQIVALRRDLAGLATAIAAQREKIAALRGDREVSSYLLLAGKLKRHEVALSSEQEVGWRRLSAQVAPALRTLAQLGEAANGLDAESQAVVAAIDEILAAREQACQGIACTVDQVTGDTRVSTLLVRVADLPLAVLPGKDLKARLRRADSATKPLFAGAAGRFAWIYPAPPA